MAVDFRRIVAQDPTIGAGNFFHRFAEQCADENAIILESDADVCVGGRDYGRSLTVADLRDIVNQLAVWLLEHGVSKRLPVAVFINDSPLYYIYYIALNRIGAIPVFLNSLMSGSVAAQYLRRVGCFAIVVDRTTAMRLEPHVSSLGQGPRIFLAESIEFSGEVPDHEPFCHGERDTVLIAHTSGTTGAPKPVQFNHSGYYFGVRQQMFHALGRKVISALPHSHGSAITMFMSTAVRTVPLFAQTKKDPEHFLDTIETWRPNLVMAFPKPLVDLCRVDLERRDLSSVACWMSTGDASHESHIRRLIRFGSRRLGGVNRPGSLYIDNLGSSEFAFGILRNVHSPETDSYDRCIGRPFEWVDVEIFGEDGRAVATNTVGRLGVKSPSVTSGYWNDDAATQMNTLHGYWLTGDLVFRADSGLYYHVDRTTDRALVSDRMFYSCQLEELLLKQIPEIFDCTVVGINGDGEQGLAVGVEPADRACDAPGMMEKIQAVLKMSGVTAAARIEMVAPGWNEGLTGKKLKRVIRESHPGHQPSAPA